MQAEQWGFILRGMHQYVYTDSPVVVAAFFCVCACVSDETTKAE